MFCVKYVSYLLVFRLIIYYLIFCLLLIDVEIFLTTQDGICPTQSTIQPRRTSQQLLGLNLDNLHRGIDILLLHIFSFFVDFSVKAPSLPLLQGRSGGDLLYDNLFTIYDVQALLRIEHATTLQVIVDLRTINL